MKAINLCSCNNCGRILEDNNALLQSIMYEIPPGVYRELSYDEDEAGPFRGCPYCGTDGYLNDFINEEELYQAGDYMHNGLAFESPHIDANGLWEDRICEGHAKLYAPGLYPVEEGICGVRGCNEPAAYVIDNR